MSAASNAARMEQRWSTGRLEAFSDGVIAIAITLLVLEISVPEAAFDDLWRGILDQWPSYLGYVTSFVTIGGFWLVHHSIVRRLDSADSRVMQINLLFLMLVAFLPFPTQLVAEAITRSSAERVAAVFYGVALLAIAIVVAVLWRYIATHRALLRDDVTEEEISTLTAQTAPNIGFYAAIIVLAIFAPQVAAWGYLVIALVSVFRQRGDRTATAA